ncbi:V-set and immunoglobulin domain-containing protein 10-like [Hoplias malabaricus]|uniref:V-set and immunoglobulin domain-containing protein 10-like n=1 Tax=Hoplias malabaricus TaxID=27720 RepID=UPI003462B3BA
MTIFGVVFLFSLLCQTATAADDQEQPFVITGEKGLSVTLPCFGRLDNGTLLVTRWKKAGEILIWREQSHPEQAGHLSILDDGSLKITGLLTIDENLYECAPVPRNGSSSRSILLQVAYGPTDMAIDIKPFNVLPNETIFVKKGNNVSFKCSSMSEPSQNLTWFFQDVRRAFAATSQLEFEINNIQPADQGNYTCTAYNPLNNRTVMQTQELLVYYDSDRHPNCSWEQVTEPDLIHFTCSWYEVYPSPILQVFLTSKTDTSDVVIDTKATENLGVTLNRTMLYEGQNITCKARHMETTPGQEKSCFFTLKSPYPMGEPLVAVLEGKELTLSCTEGSSFPPAKTVWQKGKNKETIVPSSRYILDVQGPVLTLTIKNVTKGDEDYYFCWSENVLGAKMLEVYLTVKSSADISGVMVGVFISVLIVIAGVTVGILAYSRRDRICLSLRFSALEEDRTDVVSLVESDDGDVFNDTVPSLPPISNGLGPIHATTLVEIHRIQSSDHEDNLNDADQTDPD